MDEYLWGRQTWDGDNAHAYRWWTLPRVDAHVYTNHQQSPSKTIWGRKVGSLQRRRRSPTKHTMHPLLALKALPIMPNYCVYCTAARPSAVFGFPNTGYIAPQRSQRIHSGSLISVFSRWEIVRKRNAHRVVCLVKTSALSLIWTCAGEYPSYAFALRLPFPSPVQCLSLYLSVEVL